MIPTPWIRRSVATVAVLVALTSACSSDDGGVLGDHTEPVPACTDVYADGRPTADVLKETQCDRGGELFLNVMGSFGCPDGRTLHWNDDGWGYSDGLWSHHGRVDGQLVPPQADYDACSG